MSSDWEMLEGKQRYYVGYVDSVARLFGDIFENIAQQNCNVFLTLTEFLKSNLVKGIYMGNPKYLNMTYIQLMDSFEFNWRATEKIEAVDGDEAGWTGTVLAYFQWRYSVDFEDWLKYFTVNQVYTAYYPLNEASYQNVTEKLWKAYSIAKGGTFIV